MWLLPKITLYPNTVQSQQMLQRKLQREANTEPCKIWQMFSNVFFFAHILNWDFVNSVIRVITNLGYPFTFTCL